MGKRTLIESASSASTASSASSAKRVKDGQGKKPRVPLAKKKSGKGEKKAEKKAAEPDVARESFADREEIAKQLNKLVGSIQLLEREEEETRVREVLELYLLLKGKVLKYSARHDLCRSIQCCFRFGTEAMRDTILKELQGKMVSLSKGKYSCFLVIAFLRYSDERQRCTMLNELRGHMMRLATHNCGARVLDFAFTNCDIDLRHVAGTEDGNKKKKNSRTAKKEKKDELEKQALLPVASARKVLRKLRMEFYGTEFAIFGQAQAQAQAAASPAAPAMTASAMFATLDLKKQRVSLAALHRIATKQAEKGILRYSFAHSIMRTLITHCEELMAAVDETETKEQEASKEEAKILQEMAPLVTEACLALIASEDGAHVVVRCIAHSGAKERKKLVRSLKGHVAALAFHDFGFLVLVALLHVMDDTVLMKRTLAPELLDEAVLARTLDGCLAADGADAQAQGLASARFVLLELLTGSSKRYLRRTDLVAVQPAAGTSKKDMKVRKAEFCAMAKDPMLAMCKGKVAAMLQRQHACDVLVEVAQAYWDDDLLKEIIDAVKASPELLEAAVSQRALKRIIIAEAADEDDRNAQTFAENMLNLLMPNLETHLDANATCFLLVALAEHPVTAKPTKAALNKLNKKINAAKAPSAGVKILRKILLSSK